MKRVRKYKAGFAALAAALILGIAVGGTLAYIITRTDAVTNTFTPGEVSCEVNEDFNETTKSNVNVTNTGDTAAYIRVAVVANWCDADGNIVEPWNSTSLPVLGAWDLGTDGYYYYTSPVAAGGTTGNLFDSYTPGMNGDLHLEMNVIAQAIQSTPTSAVEAAWGVTVAGNGTISK